MFHSFYSNKPARARLRQHYVDGLEKLYAAAEERKRKDLLRNVADLSLEEKFKAAVQLTLGVDSQDLAMDRSFVHLGGDSLHAVRFSEHVGSLLNVSIPVASILNTTASLDDILRMVKEESDNVGAKDSFNVTVTSVHGNDSTLLRADDLKLKKFIPHEELEQAAARPQATMRSPPEVVLLTGANGFLGRQLLVEVVRHVSLVGDKGEVVCIVRAPNDEKASERLYSSFGEPGSELRQFVEGYAKHLTVYAGDLARPHLGLKEEVFNRLCNDVDVVLHNGALVNHTFTYEQLFLPNVVGTAQLIRLALTGKRKSFQFVSTVGVSTGYSTNEDDYGDRLHKERKTDVGYASGYGSSKWACEVLLQRASEDYGLPVAFYRCGMIMPHSGSGMWLGQLNVSDFFTRLVCGLVYSGIAPPSFYDPKSPCRPVFNGLAVDFVAKSIVGLGVLPQDEGTIQAFHVIEADYKNGQNLDNVVDSIKSAGYAIERLDDHEQWAKQFRQKCEGMNGPEKQASPIPLMHQWEKPQVELPTMQLSADRYRAAVKDRLGLDNLPGISEGLVHHCLEHMVALGLISSSTTSSE